jgi:hypothetical protein
VPRPNARQCDQQDDGEAASDEEVALVVFLPHNVLPLSGRGGARATPGRK